MEKESIGIIVVVAFVIVYTIYMFYFIRHVRKVHNSKTFVYPKTGKKYYTHKIVKSKNPDTGEWYDAVLYESLEDKAIYVRKYSDFVLKFQTLDEWKRNNPNK